MAWETYPTCWGWHSLQLVRVSGPYVVLGSGDVRGAGSMMTSSREGYRAYEQKRVDLAKLYAIFPSTWTHCSRMLYFLQVLSTAIGPKVAKWTRFCPLKNDKKRYKHGEKGKLPNRLMFTPPTWYRSVWALQASPLAWSNANRRAEGNGSVGDACWSARPGQSRSI